MNEQKYSDEEIVKAFKVFIKKVVHNAAIDYARKIKSVKYKEVLFSELVDRKVSLFNYDNDTFFDLKTEFSIENLKSDTNSKLRNIISNLKEKDKLILELWVKGKSNLEIAEKLNLNEKTIRNRKSLMKKDIIEGLENKNEDIDK